MLNNEYYHIHITLYVNFINDNSINTPYSIKATTNYRDWYTDYLSSHFNQKNLKILLYKFSKSSHPLVNCVKILNTMQSILHLRLHTLKHIIT